MNGVWVRRCRRSMKHAVLLVLLVVYQSDHALAAYQHASRMRRLPERCTSAVPHEAAHPVRCGRAFAQRSATMGLAAIASASISQESAPAIKAPRGATRIFTRRVFAALVGVICAVTLILTAAERWPVYDSLYFTTTTLATIGFGDLRPLTRVGRTVTSLLGVSGVGLLGGLVSAVVGEWEQSRSEDTEAASLASPASRWAWLQPWEKGWAWVRASRPALYAGLELLRVSALLLGVGTAGFKACEPGRSWLEAARPRLRPTSAHHAA